MPGPSHLDAVLAIGHQPDVRNSKSYIHGRHKIVEGKQIAWFQHTVWQNILELKLPKEFYSRVRDAEVDRSLTNAACRPIT